MECSVGKGRDRASEQLEAYRLLCKAPLMPKSVLVNGRSKRCKEYDFEIYIDLSLPDTTTVEQAIVGGMIDFSNVLLAELI